MTDHPKTPNRLAQEKSPYLLQHAYNPVDWYPWGDEAFNEALSKDKPIFLSIGYSTCHWCHVMERESFENEEIAAIMNDTFINIKVDREELPDVDQQYMEFAQSMISGATGWPLNLLLTPDLKPFFAVTYLPPTHKHGLLGMLQFTKKIGQLWQSEQKTNMIIEAEKIVEIFEYHRHQKGQEIPTPSILAEAMEKIYYQSDAIYGGNLGSPKFPIGFQTSFLIDYGISHSEGRALFLAEKNLEMMHRGGIYDHLGGGFSRYSVDERWLVPHFEKMLYDNALLLEAYVDGWLVSNKSLYREVCQETANYILREMMQKEGGFFCAEDSETLGSEGLYYTWHYDEIEQLIHHEDKELFLEFYNITREGNYDGVIILNRPQAFEDFCQSKKIDPEKTKSNFNKIRELLLKVRNTREKPFKDDKILTSWNGLMIQALAKAGAALDKQEFIDAAEKAASFIKNHLWKEGILYRRWRDAEKDFRGNLDDYALLIRALLTLFEVTSKADWFSWALELTQKADETFKDEKGIFYQTGQNENHLLLRKCQFSDGSEPSGTAIHAENLLRLHEMTGEEKFFSDAEEIFKDVKSYLESYPPGYVYHLRNLLRYENPKKTLVVVALSGKEKDGEIEEISRYFFSKHRLHHTIVWLQPGSEYEFPTLKDKTALDGKTTFYVCQQGVCLAPTHELQLE